MKKLFLSVIGLYIGVLAAFSQNADSAYKKRRLSFEEANIISSYYHQDGNNAATTGGIGSEKLSDFANTIDVKWSKFDKYNRKQSLTAELGVDHYTSASSDKVDPSTVTSASYADTRIYPSLSWSMENAKKGSGVGAGVSYSSEFDYNSIGANINFSKKTKDRTGEFNSKLQVYLDKLRLIYPIELRGQAGREEGWTGRNTFSGSFSWSQIINTQFQLMLEGEVVYQEGYLGLPFHRVYFNDNSVNVENLPSTRLKIPLGIRANYFVGDKFIIRTWYRNYHDNWGINSNSAQLETVFKITPFFSVTPFYRFYQQSAVDYFAPYAVHAPYDEFFTSNYDLSKFNSNFYGAGFRIAPPNGVLNIQRVNSLEIRYGHYQRSTGLNSNIISMNIKFR